MPEVSVSGHTFEVRIEELPPRRVAVRRHAGREDAIEETRRPLYQHLIMHELVGGPPVLRYRPDGIDVLVGTTEGFDGDDEVEVEMLPAGWYAIMDFEGPPEDLPAARDAVRVWATGEGHSPEPATLQVHIMDTIDGVAEQQIQVPLAD